MDFFNSKCVISPDDVVKEGWLVKQSKYRKVWRERWCVLTLENLFTFKSEKNYTSPTETIDFNQIKTVRSDECSTSNIFKIEIDTQCFAFQAKSFEEKEAWIGAIGKIMVKNSKPNIFIDEELEKRTKNYQKSSTIQNIQKHREKYSLTLRKDKLFDNIMDKRLNTALFTNSPNSYFGILSDSVRLAEEDMLIFNNTNDEIEMVDLLKKWLLINDHDLENSYKRFAIFHLRKLYVKSNGLVCKLKDALLDEELLRTIMRDMVMINNNDIKFELSFILTKITYFSNTTPNLLCDADFLATLLLYTYTSPVPIIENILIIFGNLMVENKKFMLNNTNIVIRLEELLTNYNPKTYKMIIVDEEKINISIILLWNLNLVLLDLTHDEIVQFNDMILSAMNIFTRDNIMSMKAFDSLQEELNQVLLLLVRFSHCDRSLKVMLNCNIMERLIYLLQYLNIPYSKNLKFEEKEIIPLSVANLTSVLKIISNIYTLNNEELVIIKDHTNQIIEIFENLLLRYRIFHKHDRNILVNIVWTLSNIATGCQSEVDKLCSSKIPELLLTYFMKEESVIQEILVFFINTLTEASFPGVISILKAKFLKSLCHSFKSFDKLEIIISCLTCFEKIFLLIMHVCDNSDINSNPGSCTPAAHMISEIESHSVITRLEQLSIHNNIKVSGYAEALLKKVEDLIKDIHRSN